MTIAVAAAVIFVAITVGFMLRHRLRAAADSSRGFTLQTLIVTAVLVLVAVGATVIFIALSRSNEDNLADSTSDIEAREAQHGVIDSDGNLSYTWRCSLHEEYVLNKNGDGGTCQTRCYAKLNYGGVLKWNRLNPSDPLPLPSDDGTEDNGSGIFNPDDFGQIVYSENARAFGEFELRGNGNAIVLDGTCILASQLCDFNEQRREALIRRWEDSVARSQAGQSGGITFPGNILGLRDYLKC